MATKAERRRACSADDAVDVDTVGGTPTGATEAPEPALAPEPPPRTPPRRALREHSLRRDRNTITMQVGEKEREQ